MGKTFKDTKLVLEGGYVRTAIEGIHDYNSNVNRGCGKHKAKKGNGSYTRKEKHKSRLAW